MKKCLYCQNMDKPHEELEVGDIYLVCAQYIFVGDGSPCVLPILYCPHCGRRIEEEENNE